MNREELTYKKIFKFWYPLAATWLMMATEGPFIAALIARMIEPKANLAAYGVAFSIAIIVEAPVIMIMSASTALVKNSNSFFKLRNFTYAANGLITILMLILLIPPVFNFFAIYLIELPTHVAELTYSAILILLPWPAAIGYRRFYQGILINSNQTGKVAYGTVVRLLSMALTGSLLFLFSDFNGVEVGAAALSVGVCMEAIASKMMAYKLVNKLKDKTNISSSNNLTYNEIFKFYYPLALTSVLSLAVHPMVTFFMGQSKLPVESLAVLPVINSLVFIFRAFGLSYTEVGITLFGKDFSGYKKLKNFAFGMSIIVTAMLFLIAFTPLSEIWFHNISGLSLELTEIAIVPLMIISLMPGLTVLINFQRAVLVFSKNTAPLTIATVIEVTGIILVLIFTIKGYFLVGAIAATLSFIFGRLAANIYLMLPMIKSVKKNLNLK